MSFFSYNTLSRNSRTCTAGVCGIKKGCGVTHFCMILGVFLGLYAGKKTVVLDMAGSGDYLCFKKKYKESGEGFYMKGIYFLPYAEQRDISWCIDKGFDICIIDFGVGNSKTMNELARCDVKTVIGPAASWLYEGWKDFFEMNCIVEDWSSFKLCVNLYGTSVKNISKKEFKNFIGLPFQPDIFKPSDGMVRLFYNMFNDVLS